MVFPRWANYIVPLLLLGVFAGVPFQFILVGFGANPTTTDVGYQPHQPIPYSHELHVTQLGMDCRYCHSTVEKAGFAAIPPSSTCMNCHHAIRKNSDQLKPLYATFKDGMPVEWVKVHDLPDYAYFNHSAHINKGVSCVSCHGRVDRMDGQGVKQVEPLSMGWCLNCHREPAANLRPIDQVTNLMWGLNLTQLEIDQIASMGLEVKDMKVGGQLTAEQRLAIGRKIHEHKNIKTARQLSDCSACHR
jgi:hypothetical protein